MHLMFFLVNTHFDENYFAKEQHQKDFNYFVEFISCSDFLCFRVQIIWNRSKITLPKKLIRFIKTFDYFIGKFVAFLNKVNCVILTFLFDQNNKTTFFMLCPSKVIFSTKLFLKVLEFLNLTFCLWPPSCFSDNKYSL